MKIRHRTRARRSVGRPSVATAPDFSRPSQGRRGRAGARGIVLVLALVMLAAMSLLAVMSSRNAVSTESALGSVRTTNLALQAAEAALRYCEQAVIQFNVGTGTFASLPTIQSYTTTPTWSNLSNWDGVSSTAYVTPIDTVNAAGVSVTFQRSPECIVQRMPVAVGTSTIATNLTAGYIVTARGFGPEVAAADASRTRPTGSEAWVQSTIELE